MNKFISESEAEEKRKKRQEEWERVRKPEDPKEAPEEVYDPRSLYERLQEQKDKKQSEFEETHKFKNQFRGVDKDEVNFLDEVAKQSSQIERNKNDEIKKELEEFKKAVAERALSEQVNPELKKTPKTHNVVSAKRKINQSDLIKVAVKRKRNSSSSNVSGNESKDETDSKSSADRPENEKANFQSNVDLASGETMVYPSARKCVGVLPGIGSYSDDSESSSVEIDSDSDESEELS